MTKRNLLLIGLALTLVCASVVLVWLLLAPPHPQPGWTLEDGSKIRLARITYGTNHVYNYGHRLLDLIYPVLPAAIRTNFSSKVVRITTPQQELLGIWFDSSEMSVLTAGSAATAGGLLNFNGVGPLVHGFIVSVGDASGLESARFWAGTVREFTNRTGIYVAWVIHFPRSSEFLDLKIYEAPDSPSAVGRIKVRNPAARHPSKANWVPEALPATHKTNELEVSLTDFGRGGPVGVPSPLGTVHASFTVRVNGEFTSDWNIVRMIVYNGPGETNQFDQPMVQRTTWPYSDATLSFPLWHDEPAWRLRVEVAKTSGFGPAEFWRQRGIDLTSNLGAVALDIPTNFPVGGRPAAVSGRIEFQRSGPAQNRAWRSPVWFKLQTADSIWLSLISVSDNDGRYLKPQNMPGLELPPAGSTGPPSRKWSQPFIITGDPRTVDVSIVLSPVYTFEFTVEPAQVRASRP